MDIKCILINEYTDCMTRYHKKLLSAGNGINLIGNMWFALM